VQKSSSGGQGIFLNFSLGAEEEMVDVVRDSIVKHGLI